MKMKKAEYYYSVRVRRPSQNDYFESFSLYILGHDHTGEIISVASQITMEDYKKFSVVPPGGIIRFPEENAQQIIDELWVDGIRPSGYLEPRGQIQAMNEHIKDLRVVAKITGKPA